MGIYVSDENGKLIKYAGKSTAGGASNTPTEDPNKANVDASNLTEENVSTWKEKLGVGESGTKVIFAYYD